MDYLDAFQFIQDALDSLKDGKKDQVPKNKIDDVMFYIYACKDHLKRADMTKVGIKLGFERVVQSLDATKRLDVEMIPDSVRDIILESLHLLKRELAFIIYAYFTVNDFDETVEEDVKILEEVIRIKRGA